MNKFRKYFLIILAFSSSSFLLKNSSQILANKPNVHFEVKTVLKSKNNKTSPKKIAKVTLKKQNLKIPKFNKTGAIIIPNSLNTSGLIVLISFNNNNAACVDKFIQSIQVQSASNLSKIATFANNKAKSMPQKLSVITIYVTEEDLEAYLNKTKKSIDQALRKLTEIAGSIHKSAIIPVNSSDLKKASIQKLLSSINIDINQD